MCKGEFLEALSNLGLEKLYLISCHGIEPDSLQRLANFTGLVDLTLYDRKTNDLAMTYLADINGLKSLYVADGEVSADGIVVLNDLDSLEVLEFQSVVIQGPEIQKALDDLKESKPNLTLQVLHNLCKADTPCCRERFEEWRRNLGM